MLLPLSYDLIKIGLSLIGTNVIYFLAVADGSKVSMDAEQKMDGIRPIQNKVP